MNVAFRSAKERYFRRAKGNFGTTIHPLIFASAITLLTLLGCTSSTAPTRPERPADGPSVALPGKPKPPTFDASINLDALLDARLTLQELDNGWIRLFDDATMMGWTATSNANWSIADGEISASEGDQGF